MLVDPRQRTVRDLILAFITFFGLCLIPFEEDRVTTLSVKTTTKTKSKIPAGNGLLSSTSASSSSSSSQSSITITTEQGWWNEYVPNISRVYTPWNGTTPYGWCIPSPFTQQRDKKSEDPANSKGPISGLIYIKSPKTSSSTCQGITINIAHHVGRQITTVPASSSSTSSSSSSSSSESSVATTLPCTFYSRHGFAESKGHGRPRQRDTSLLWTLVRHPAARDLSGIMYVRVRNGMDPTDENILRVLSDPGLQGKQVKYLLPSKKTEQLVVPDLVRTQPKKVAEVIQTYILEYYDFIGITERMDESLAVMTLLWGLDPTDVIVLSAKTKGGYTPLGNTRLNKDGTRSKKKSSKTICVTTPKANRTKAVEEFLHSEEYQSTNADFLLYHAAWTSLDRTIDNIGRDIVQNRVNYIQQLQQLAESQCAHVAQFPCSHVNANQKPNWELAQQSCYREDAGCGHQCVDQVLLPNRTIPFIH